jgi:hypothetical protein
MPQPRSVAKSLGHTGAAARQVETHAHRKGGERELGK